MMGPKALLFVPENELRDMRSTLTNYMPFIQQFTRATNLDSLFALVNYQIYHAKKNAKPTPRTTRCSRRVAHADPHRQRKPRHSLRRPGTPPSPGIFALFGADDGEARSRTSTSLMPRARFFSSRGARATEELNFPAVERLSDLKWRKPPRKCSGLNVGLTGEPVLDHDQMQQSQKDSRWWRRSCRW